MNDLLDKKQVLSDMIDIQDMQWYGAAWLQLAREFSEIGMDANANYCRARGEHYSRLAGAFTRVVSGSLAELVPA